MSSGNPDRAFVSNCDHHYNYMAHIQSIVLCSNVLINLLHSIMELMLLWISKRLKMELLLLYIAIFINCITIFLNNWLYSCAYSNNFVHFFIGVDWEWYSQPDQFLVARAASDLQSF